MTLGGVSSTPPCRQCSAVGCGAARRPSLSGVVSQGWPGLAGARQRKQCFFLLGQTDGIKAINPRVVVGPGGLFSACSLCSLCLEPPAAALGPTPHHGTENKRRRKPGEMKGGGRGVSPALGPGAAETAPHRIQPPPLASHARTLPPPSDGCPTAPAAPHFDGHVDGAARCALAPGRVGPVGPVGEREKHDGSTGARPVPPSATTRTTARSRSRSPRGSHDRDMSYRPAIAHAARAARRRPRRRPSHSLALRAGRCLAVRPSDSRPFPDYLLSARLALAAARAASGRALAAPPYRHARILAECLTTSGRVGASERVGGGGWSRDPQQAPGRHPYGRAASPRPLLPANRPRTARSQVERRAERSSGAGGAQSIEPVAPNLSEARVRTAATQSRTAKAAPAGCSAVPERHGPRRSATE